MKKEKVRIKLCNYCSTLSIFFCFLEAFFSARLAKNADSENTLKNQNAHNKNAILKQIYPNINPVFLHRVEYDIFTVSR